jgi:uncharacterized protein (PEP-CTERM system associated)
MTEARGGERRPLPTGRMDSSARSWPWSPLFLLVQLAACACPAYADSWNFKPALSAIETYTDNIGLVSDNLRQTERITQIVPRFALNAATPRFRLNAVYEPELTYYAYSTREDRVFQRGQAVGTLELVPKSLFLEGGAKEDQYHVTLTTGPFNIGNVSSTSDLASIKTRYLSPYLRYAIGSAARGEVRATHSEWEGTGQNVLADNTADKVNLRLENGPAQKRFTWGLDYSKETITYVVQQQTTSEESKLGARLAITPSVGLQGIAGYESYDPGVGGLVSKGNRWGAGLDWSPGPRTRISGMAGKRLEHDSYQFEFRHRTRLTNWSATYSEDVTTTRSQFFVPETASTASTLDQLFAAQYPDPIERQKAVQDFIAKSGLPPSLTSPQNFFTDVFFRQRTWNASTGWLGSRNSVVLSAFWQERDVLFSGVQASSGDFASTDSIRVSGASMAWGLRLTPHTNWNVNAGRSRQIFLDTNRVDDFTYARLGLTQQFQQKIYGSLEYRWQRNESTVTNLGYTEHAAIATIRVRY